MNRLESGFTPELTEIQRFFVDPENPQSAEDLVKLGADTIRAMAEIFATRGDISKMTTPTKKWLSTPELAETLLEQKVGEILKKESKTRLYDIYFMGQIVTQGNKIGIISNLIGAYMDTNRIYRGVSPSEAEMETDSIKWLANIFGYNSEQSGGNITTGGTTANIEALWIAREKAFDSIHINIRKNNTPLYVLVSKYRHYSIDKACEMLGLRLVTIPDNGNYKIDIKALDKRAEKISRVGGKIIAMVGIAGETETGMIENLEGIAGVAQKFESFFHVDAAYGGPYILSKAKDKFKGIDQADSITVDPHKMLYTPYAAGCILFKNENDHLLISKIHSTRYLRNVVARVEGSMASSGVIATWATIQLLGTEGISTLLNSTLDLTNFSYERLLSSNILRPIFKPELNTILIGLRDDLGLSPIRYNSIMECIEEIVEKIEKGKTMYVSRNEKIDKGLDAFRFLVNSPYTTKQSIEELLSFLENEVKAHI